jgi:hypothetical protein
MTTPTGPRSGEDTCDLIDEALCQLAERRNAWPGDPLTAITLVASLTGQAGRMLPRVRPRSPRPRRHLARHHDRPGHQHRTGRTPLQPRLTRRRHQVALQHLTRPTATQRNQPPSQGGQISPVGKGSIFKRR